MAKPEFLAGTNDNTYLHLNEDVKYGYDAVIIDRSNGTRTEYETNTDWDDHAHIEYKKSGETSYERDEGENHSWENRYENVPRIN